MMEDRDVLKGLEKVLDMLRVKSLDNGNMLIEITYRGEVPSALSRVLIAEEIGELLHRRIGKLRSRKRS